MWFEVGQVISGEYRVILPRYNTRDTIEFCPLPMTIKFRYRAFKGNVAPQLIIDLDSLVNSEEYENLTQKVEIGSGNTPTLVTPYQVQRLMTSQRVMLSQYTINLYGRDANPSPFLRQLQSTIARGFENILDTNGRINEQKIKQLSKELVTPQQLQAFKDTVNRTIDRFNSARTSQAQRTLLSHEESWNFFSVLAKGALEYLRLKDQPAKWIDDEWKKFISASKDTFKWERKAGTENIWRIRAINLVRLSSRNQVDTTSIRTAKFTLSALTTASAQDGISLECKGIAGDHHCDASEKQGSGKGCGADCGCCWNETRAIVLSKYPLHINIRQLLFVAKGGRAVNMLMTHTVFQIEQGLSTKLIIIVPLRNVVFLFTPIGTTIMLM